MSAIIVQTGLDRRSFSLDGSKLFERSTAQSYHTNCEDTSPAVRKELRSNIILKFISLRLPIVSAFFSVQSDAWSSKKKENGRY